jgi:glycosyltransferase involved in cell wall biosynthesis
MVVYSFYESDNRVRRYAEALARRGDIVEVIALRQSDAAAQQWHNTILVHKIQYRQLNERGKWEYLGRLLLFFVRSMFMLLKRHLAKRFDVVHVHSVPDFEIFAAAPLKLSGTKLILDIHDIVPELFCSKFDASHDSMLFKALVVMERLSTAMADRVIVANHLWHARLIKRSVQPHKCSVIMNYPDPAHFATLSPRPIAGRFRLLYPGTLSRHQGLQTAIEAVQLLHSRIEGLELHIYGKGNDEALFRTMVQRLKLEQQVIFHGPVPMEEVAVAMSQCHLGVEPKFNTGFSNEAFSTKILEFMLAGVPVVVSDTAVHRYYIDESLVHYVPAGDSAALAGAIAHLYAQPEICRGYVQRAHNFIKTFNWHCKQNEYLELVDSMNASS